MLLTVKINLTSRTNIELLMPPQEGEETVHRLLLSIFKLGTFLNGGINPAISFTILLVAKPF